jgi:LemA protein
MWIVIAIVGLPILWAVVSYNLLVRGRNLVSEAWSGIDVQLKRRHDLIPNIVECVKAYSAHERELFEKVTESRAASLAAGAIPARTEAENAVTGQLKALLGVAEAYPELKANTNFLELQSTLSKVEDDIQYARRYYNAVVRDYNIRVQSFPGVIIARAFGFEARDYFEIEYATERQTPDAKFA